MIYRYRRLGAKIFLGIYFKESIEHFELIIINCAEKYVGFVDPLQLNSSNEEYLNQFLDFVDKYNETSSSKIPMRNAWNTFHHQKRADDFNRGVFVLQFIKQYLQTGRINEPFDPSDYRKELQYMILRKSIKMSTRCVICGFGKVPDKIVNWVKCDVCPRWAQCKRRPGSN